MPETLGNMFGLALNQFDFPDTFLKQVRSKKNKALIRVSELDSEREGLTVVV